MTREQARLLERCANVPLRSIFGTSDAAIGDCVMRIREANLYGRPSLATDSQQIRARERSDTNERPTD
jgi:hypothetical protein